MDTRMAITVVFGVFRLMGGPRLCSGASVSARLEERRRR
jgi:hypothetical protein